MNAPIRQLGDPNRAFWLTRSMARTVDVNLTEAMHESALVPADYAAMVTRCRMCPDPEGCEAWLAVHGAGADRVPDHCANSEMLNALLPKKRR